MVETYGAHYVSLHVRVSNTAAIHLYRHTLGFQQDKVETKYYADGEDAYCMRLDLGPLREQLRLEREENEEEESEANEKDEKGEGKKNKKSKDTTGKLNGAAGKGEDGQQADEAHPDEGEPAGDVGRDPAKAKGEKKRKVKVGRALGVGELVERDETNKHAS